MTLPIQYLSQSELGYLGGIIDGEGHIGIHTGMANGKRTWSIQLSIANTDERMIDWLEEKLPGIARVWNNGIHQLGKHPVYVWRVKPRYAPQLLKLVSPYLIIKRHRAEALSQGYKHLGTQQRDELVESLRIARRPHASHPRPVPFTSGRSACQIRPR